LPPERGTKNSDIRTKFLKILAKSRILATFHTEDPILIFDWAVIGTPLFCKKFPVR
jgi:hypothetical protein